jgi:hypothetical protein
MHVTTLNKNSDTSVHFIQDYVSIMYIPLCTYFLSYACYIAPNFIHRDITIIIISVTHYLGGGGTTLIVQVEGYF